MKKLILFLSILSLTVSCVGDDSDRPGINCTSEARVALVVTIKDAVTGTLITDGITVTAIDGDFSEVLTNEFWETGEFSGVFERHGNYTITVTGAGYQNYTSNGITVGSDACHVITETLTINLQPE
ncbi:MAG: carboxypeptidase regulatory-like domain-containing protein [Flavobacterium sp.]|nr:MAG: carboxypeptidase regulatory-like domain-containing protein [Flavobacterium sp.]